MSGGVVRNHYNVIYYYYYYFNSRASAGLKGVKKKTITLTCEVFFLQQPRFCVFGEGVNEAAELEQTGKKDAVHCSSEFLEILTTAKAHDIMSRRHAAAGVCVCVCVCVCVYVHMYTYMHVYLGVFLVRIPQDFDECQNT